MVRDLLHYYLSDFVGWYFLRICSRNSHRLLDYLWCWTNPLRLCEEWIDDVSNKNRLIFLRKEDETAKIESHRGGWVAVELFSHAGAANLDLTIFHHNYLQISRFERIDDTADGGGEAPWQCFSKSDKAGLKFGSRAAEGRSRHVPAARVAHVRRQVRVGWNKPGKALDERDCWWIAERPFWDMFLYYYKLVLYTC